MHDDLEALREENRCLKNTLTQQLSEASSENRDVANVQTLAADSPIDLQRELKASGCTYPSRLLLGL